MEKSQIATIADVKVGATLMDGGKGGLYLTAEAVPPVYSEDELEEDWG